MAGYVLAEPTSVCVECRVMLGYVLAGPMLVCVVCRYWCICECLVEGASGWGCSGVVVKKRKIFFFFFFNDTATPEIYTSLFVGSVRGV